jgi:RNA polymerase sigma-70 factor (ECF subfamily)
MSDLPSTIFLRKFLADPKNHELFGTFAAKYQLRIKRCCLAKGLQDADADDLTAKILLRFFERDIFDGLVLRTKVQFYGWLREVVKNAVLTFIRDRGRKPDAWSVGNPDAQDSLERKSEEMARDLEAVYEEDLERAAQACATVKERVEEKTWQAFYLLTYEGRTTDEVAQQLAMSKSSVWTARSRVLQKLREELRNLHGPADGQK